MAIKAQPSQTAKAPSHPTDQRVVEPAALYRLYSADGTLLYIGVTDNPERRFTQHRDTKPWWPQVARKNVEWYVDRRRALADESAAIDAETPVYNIEHNPAAQLKAVDPHEPPADMPAARVDALRQAADGLPTDLGQAVLRAGVKGFVDSQRTHGLKLITAVPAAVDTALRQTFPDRYTPELVKEIAADATGKILSGLEDARTRMQTEGLGSPELNLMIDEVAKLVESAPDPHEALHGAIQVMAARREGAATECPVWPGVCTRTTPGHQEHLNFDHFVLDKSGNELVSVSFVQYTDEIADGSAVVSIEGEDFAPEEVRAKTAELRLLLDAADELADKVIALREERAVHS